MNCLDIYFNNIRHTFPVYHKKEKAYFKNFKECVYDYAENLDSLDMDKITLEFGTPAEVVASYLSNVENDYLMRNIKHNHIVKSTALVICIALLAILGYRTYRLELAIQKAEDAIAYSFEEVITEETLD